MPPLQKLCCLRKESIKFDPVNFYLGYSVQDWGLRYQILRRYYLFLDRYNELSIGEIWLISFWQFSFISHSSLFSALISQNRD